MLDARSLVRPPQIWWLQAGIVEFHRNSAGRGEIRALALLPTGCKKRANEPCLRLNGEPAMPEPLDRFLRLHDELRERFPKSIEDACELAKSTVDPKTECPEEMWGILWDKPLFANVRVAGGVNWRKQIESEMPGAWRTWGTDIDAFRICRVRLGHELGDDCFKVHGKQAKEFVKRHANIPRHRLYAIQGAASAMRSCCRPFAHLPDFPDVSEANVRELEDIFGWRWGRTTVMHALTDVGLSVKPDTNLARTVRTIDLVPGLPENRISTLAQAAEINRAVFELLVGIRSAGRTGITDIPNPHRYIDKVLMEISRQGLLGPAGHNRSAKPCK